MIKSWDNMDDVKQMVLICLVVFLLGAMPMLSAWIPQMYANSQLEVVNVNF
jgi:hypothetical protein